MPRSPGELGNCGSLSQRVRVMRSGPLCEQLRLNCRCFIVPSSLCSVELAGLVAHLDYVAGEKTVAIETGAVFSQKSSCSSFMILRFLPCSNLWSATRRYGTRAIPSGNGSKDGEPASDQAGPVPEGRAKKCN